MRFGAPGFLPLLAIPAALLILWTWQLWRRRADARAFVRRRQVPVHERVPFFGELLFWLCLIAAATAAMLALARPQAVTSLVRTAAWPWCSRGRVRPATLCSNTTAPLRSLSR